MIFRTIKSIKLNIIIDCASGNNYNDFKMFKLHIYIYITYIRNRKELCELKKVIYYSNILFSILNLADSKLLFHITFYLII